MKSNIKDFTNLLAPYENQWVAISKDETTVLAHGNTLQQVNQLIMEKSLEARFMYVHGFDGVFAP